MAVKKIAVFALLALASLCFAQNIKGKRITVPEPTMQFGGEGDAWIPLFVQGQITSNLLNYSGMDVIDRQAIDKAIKEQKLSVSAAYAEEDQIQIGKLLTAHYIVVVSIIKKGSGFSLDAKITDAESGVAIGKAYNNPNCSAANMENGSAINELWYQLMAGLGVDKKNLDALHTANENQKKEIIANTYLAKGIATEKSGGSVVEALAYYQKAMSETNKITEAANRLNTMTSSLSTGNVREETLNEIKLREEWIKIWDDYHKWADENYHIEVVYSTEFVKYGKIYFEDEYKILYNEKNGKNAQVKIHEKNTRDVEIPVAIITECEQVNALYTQLMTAYNSLPYPNHQETWKLDTNRMPKKYFNSYSYTNSANRSEEVPFKLICSIYDEKNKKIGTESLTGYLQHIGGSFGYNNAAYCKSFIYDSNRKKIASEQDSVGGVDLFIVSISCKAENLTDSIAIRLEVNGLPAISREDNAKNRIEKTLPDYEYSYANGTKSIKFSNIKKGSGGWTYNAYNSFDKDEDYPHLTYMPEYYYFYYAADRQYYSIAKSRYVSYPGRLSYFQMGPFVRINEYRIYDLYNRFEDWETDSVIAAEKARLEEEARLARIEEERKARENAEEMRNAEEAGKKIKANYVDGSKIFKVKNGVVQKSKKAYGYIKLPATAEKLYIWDILQTQVFGLKINSALNIIFSFDAMMSALGVEAIPGVGHVYSLNNYLKEIVIGEEIPIEDAVEILKKTKDYFVSINVQIYVPYRLKEKVEKQKITGNINYYLY